MGHHAKAACPVAVVASTLIVFLFALLVFILPAQAQNKSLMPVPKIQFSDQNGAPVAGGHVHSYISLTTTNQATYTDSTGATPNANPVVLDAAGRGDIWLTPGESYTLALHDAADAQIWSVDGVTSGLLDTSLVVGTTAVIFTSTPTFDSSTSTYFSMTLTGNVTSSTISNASDGRIIYFNICQDATGDRTFTWPASVLNAPTVGTAASSCTSASFIYDGTNWRELAASSRGSAVFETVTPTATGKDLGSAAARWDAFLATLDISGDVTGNIVPAATGQDIGSAPNRWDAFLQDLDISGSVTGIDAGDIDDGGAASTFALFSGAAGAASFRAITTADLPTQQQIWRGGFYESAPATGLTNIPLPVADQCAAGISVERVSVAAITKGSGTMTFQVTRYNSAGASQGNIFSGNQTYSNTGDNRQDYTATTTTATANDYFRFNIVTLNGQADVSFLVEGKCDVL